MALPPGSDLYRASSYGAYDRGYRHSYGSPGAHQIMAWQEEYERETRKYKAAKKIVEDAMPKGLSEAAANVAAKKVAVQGLKFLRSFILLVMFLGLASIAWGVLGGGVLAVFAGVGPVIWFVLSGVVVTIIGGLLYYGIAVVELPDKLGEVASAEAVYAEASQREIDKWETDK